MTGQIKAHGNVIYKEEGQECMGLGMKTTRIPIQTASFQKSKYAVSTER